MQTEHREDESDHKSQMILQSFVFPDEVCKEQEVYYRTCGEVQSDKNKQRLVLAAGSSLYSDTYMNLFDYAVWGKYTVIRHAALQIELEGKGHVEIWIEQNGQKHILHSHYYYLSQRKNISIPLMVQEEGYIYFVIKAEEQTVFYKACYSTMEQAQETELTLVLCTYKREQQIKKNIWKLLQSRFWKEGSALYHKLFIRVVDNASELELVQTDNLKLYHNPNTGGSGGFTRGIVETQKEYENFKTTHIILMDDDVELELETFYRVYAFLAYIKQEFSDEVISGRMFRLDDRKIQYTASEIWNGGNIRHLGENLDVSKRENLKDINNQRGEYSGWWFAVFPYAFTVGNLPYPFFIHCDDVEYGLRHGGNPIVLNGIQVWHETYEYRQSPVIAYYDYRNRLIVNAMYGLLGEDWKKEWKRTISKYHIEKKWQWELAVIIAMNDFLKGKKGLNRVYRIDHRFVDKKLFNAISWRFVNGRIRIKEKKVKKYWEKQKR